MIKKNLICFDFETSSVNPNRCDVFQLAAIAIDQTRLEIIPNSTFSSWVKPINFERPSYYEEYKDTIDWHCKKQNCTKDVFMRKIQDAPEEKSVWKQFIQYLSQYHDRQNNQNFFSSPIPTGFNIIDFDIPIINRLCTRYNNVQKDGSQSIFFKRDIKDVLHIASLWLSPLNELKSFSLDSIRTYMGIEVEGGHNAKKDVVDTAQILLRFLRMHTALAPRANFKNSFAKHE